MDIMNQYQRQKQLERNMEKQGTIIAAIAIGVVMTPIILIEFLVVGHTIGQIVGVVMLAGVGLSFMLSKSYWNKVEAEKERTNALKDLPSELDSPSSENL
jgi:hypothetical protein